MTDTPLPRGWAAVQLGDILLAIVGGGTPSRKVPDYFNGAIPWFTVKDMQSLRPSDAEEHISEVAVRDSATNVIPPNTLVIATRIALGKAIKPTVACAINQDLKALIVRRGMDSDFLLYWVISNAKTIQDLGSGTTVSGIRLETLNALRLNLPPSAEQIRIVAKLEELLSDLDAGVAELKAAQKKLTQYRQSLLKAAVEGTLTAEWRAERAKRGEPLETGAQLLEQILAERRRRWDEKQLAKFKEQGKTPPKGWQDKYTEPVKPNTTDLPELPERWVWASAEQICDFITKGTTPPKSFLKTSQKLIPFLRVTNLTNDGSLNFNDQVFISEDIHLSLLGRSIVYPGDVLMNIVGPPLGQVSIVPADFPEFNINQAIAVFRPIGGIYSYYICSFILSDFAKKWLKFRSKTTAGQINLTLEVCRSLPVPLPSIEEQSKIRQILEYALTEANSQANDIELMLKQSSAQRQNILKAAFSGQLVPQDPNDEPASVLLERIRAERAARESGGRWRGRKAREDAA